MEIKKLQLRGISRTPSDKLTEDGGLSESLNMYLDTAESAPTLIPQDVTSRIGLPVGIDAERIFTHKTANYENYIAVLEDMIVAYTPTVEDEEPLHILDLIDNEKVVDITSVGNVLVFSTTKNMYYAIYKNRSYSFLGTKVPFPFINFGKAERESIKDAITLDATAPFFLRTTDDDITQYIPTVEDWNEDSKDNKDHSEPINNYLRTYWEVMDRARKEAYQEGFLTSSIIVRYAVDLYGSSISSPPILIPASADPMVVSINTNKRVTYTLVGNSEYRRDVTVKEVTTPITSIEKYKIHAQLSEDWDISEWKDLITNIKIYISKPIDHNALRVSSILSAREVDSEIWDVTGRNDLKNRVYNSNATITFRNDPEFINHLLETSSQAYLVKTIPILKENSKDISNELQSLLDGMVLDISEYINPENSGLIDEQERLSGDDMKHYSFTANKLDVYNNKLTLVQATQRLDYEYSRLNAYDNVDGRVRKPIRYDVTYVISGYSKDHYVKKTFEYEADEAIYSFQIFPDSRASRMLVKVTRGTETLFGDFPMTAHPYLDCAYYYGSLRTELSSKCTAAAVIDFPVDTMDDLDNKLIVAEMNKPFFFPLESRYTFQSKILGMAVATTALSQGQFGQFPLYVFTEDGIWAVEVSSTGSFISQKPLTREVCVNPDSITPIDDAVVFVTGKGVMMLQGPNIVNISPFMNGRHYIPNESALDLLRKQEGYDELIGAISDETPFTTFIRDAYVSYDYTGQRLIFFSHSNQGFQYVYKIDTQTWHKLSFDGFDIIKPINSYPDCLAQGRCLNIPLGVLNEACQLLKITSNELLLAMEDKKKLTVSDYNTEASPVQMLKNMGFEVIVDEVKFRYHMKIYIEGVINSSISEQDMHFFFYELGWTEEEVRKKIIGGTHTYIDLDISEGSAIDIDPILSKYIRYKYIESYMHTVFVITVNSYTQEKVMTSAVLSLSTILDPATTQPTAKGVLITRPFDLGYPDILKSISNVRIRGDFDKGNVKYILQGSEDGRNFYTLNSLRGKSWKMFRLFILTDLEPTERVSWIDIEFETRFNNRLR